MNCLIGYLNMAVTALLGTTSKSACVENLNSTIQRDYVLLLHGMGRSAFSMKRMEHYLSAQGYRVINVSYSSRRFSIEQLAENYLRPLLEKYITDPNAKVHFVTHSLGGIIVRQYLSTHTIENLGRIVMLGPPNHGSRIIDCLRANAVIRVFLGNAGLELGTGPDDLPERLGTVHFDCGVIAGDLSWNPIFSKMLSGPSDGKVMVQSAKVAGMRDFLVLHASHTGLMWRKQTLRETVNFLRTGSFRAV